MAGLVTISSRSLGNLAHYIALLSSVNVARNGHDPFMWSFVLDGGLDRELDSLGCLSVSSGCGIEEKNLMTKLQILVVNSMLLFHTHSMNWKEAD